MRARLLIAGLLLSVALGASADAGAVDQTFWRDDYAPRPEPARMRFGAGSTTFRFEHLRPWQDWGDETAEATGRYRYNTCRPFCAAGNYNTTGAEVQLRNPHSCHGQRRYGIIEFDPERRAFDNSEFRMSCDGVAHPRF